MKLASRLLLSALLSGTALSTANLSALAQSPDPAARRAFFGRSAFAHHQLFLRRAWAMMGTKGDARRCLSFCRKGQTINYLRQAGASPSDPPLDFMAVTDHSEFLGALRTFDDPKQRVGPRSCRAPSPR